MKKNNEFSIIETFFRHKTASKKGIVIDSGDDAAVVTPPANQQLCISIDTSISGIHFPNTLPAFDIGYRALAVAISDLAAMGATPLWSVVSLTTPDVQDEWFKQFADGMFSAAKLFGDIQIIGGDLTKCNCSISVEVIGSVPIGKAILRSGAKVGDSVFVSNTVGDAALGLKLYDSNIKWQIKTSAEQKYIRPAPQLELGIALRGIANSMIDISDGLLQDLAHLLDESKVGAKIFLEKIPLSEQLLSVEFEQVRYDYALNGGDDYQLLFTVAEDKIPDLEAINIENLKFTKIGEINNTNKLEIFSAGKPIKIASKGFQHF